MKSTTIKRAILALCVLPGASVQAAIVFSEINLVNDSIILTNTGTGNIDLGGWRFCSHDIDSVRIYSSTSQFNGMSIAAGASLSIDTTSINFAGPLGGNTMSVGLYENSSFGSADALQSFVQFGPEGTTGGGSSEFRTVTAVAAGLWDAEGSFVEVGPGQDRIVLTDLNSSVGAASFAAIPEPGSAALTGLGALFAFTRRRRKS